MPKLQPIEFCSDIFLLPLGEPALDAIDMAADEYARGRRQAPKPPARQPLPPLPWPNPTTTAKRAPPLSPRPRVPQPKGIHSYGEFLAEKLEFNNNVYVAKFLHERKRHASRPASAASPNPPSLPPPPPDRTVLAPIFESREHEEILL